MTLTIYIGYDDREPLAWMVLAHSLLLRASKPIRIVPLTRWSVSDVYTRPRGPLDSTDFSMTRFLVPAIHRRDGYALFLDCDMVAQADPWELVELARRDPGKAVYVVPHDYVPRSAVKFEGHVQTAYPRKNWSSLMLFDTQHPLFAVQNALGLPYLHRASGLELHRFAWCPDGLIGHLPLEWNWLVGEYPDNPDAKLLHYTLGGPWFAGQEHGPMASVWWDAYRAMCGPSVAV